MKLIKASAKIEDISKLSFPKAIEIAARNCYKSEGKISKDDSSAITLFSKLYKNGHHAMFEFGHDLIISLGGGKTELSEYLKKEKYITHSTLGKRVFSGSLRVWINILNTIPHSFVNDVKIAVKLALERYDGGNDIVNIITKEGVGVKSTTIKGLIIDELTKEERYIHESETVRFIVDRGISHELVRHRPQAFAQESTRYVNYKDSDIEFITPVWFSDDDIIKAQKFIDSKDTDNVDITFKDPLVLSWLNTMDDSTYIYKRMIKQGWTPQQARSILPTSLKTEILTKAKLSQWKHLLKLRTHKTAHPQFVEVAVPLFEEMKHKLKNI